MTPTEHAALAEKIARYAAIETRIAELDELRNYLDIIERDTLIHSQLYAPGETQPTSLPLKAIPPLVFAALLVHHIVEAQKALRAEREAL